MRKCYKIGWINLSLVFFLALVVRFHKLGEAPLWTDEIFSWSASHLPPSRIISYLLEGNNPPLWELLLHFWRRWWGDSEVALRSLPAIFSTLTAAALFCLGTYSRSSLAGWIAAALWIFSDYGQGVGREARAYALLGFLTALAHIAFLYWRGSNRGFYVWIITLLLLFHTHYMGVGVAILQLIFLLFDKKSTKPVILTAILFLTGGSWLIGIVFMERLISYSGSEVGTFASWEGLYNMLWRFSNQPIPTVIALLTLTGATLYQRSLMSSYPFWAFLGLFLPIGLMAWKVPIWQDRYLMSAAVGYYWLLGHAAAGLPAVGRWIGTAGLLLSWIISWNPVPPGKAPFNRHLARLIMQKPTHQPLICMPSWIALEYSYYLPLSCKGRVSSHFFDEVAQELQLRYRIFGANAYAELPVCELQATDTIWVLDYGYAWSYPGHPLPELLRHEWQPMQVWRLANHVQLWVGVRRSVD
ncbi:MAG: hypothetical protein N2200_00380 [Bacteroidia bacterium]|nr:hypothetical protein [Bacteroidia bacterium]